MTTHGDADEVEIPPATDLTAVYSLINQQNIALGRIESALQRIENYVEIHGGDHEGGLSRGADDG